MPLELKQRNERMADEISDVLAKAKEQSANCDCILVLMQGNEGGVVYVANDSIRLETLSFIATSFLHNLHRGIRL